MGMLDMLAQAAKGMLTTPQGMQGLQYLQQRHHGMMPGDIAAQRAQQSYYESMNAQRQAEEEERLKRLEQEKRQAEMRESQTAAAGILGGMSEPEKQAYLSNPQQMAWWGGPDADKGITAAALGAIAPQEGADPLLKQRADGSYVWMYPPGAGAQPAVVPAGVEGPKTAPPQRPTAKDQYGIERYTDTQQPVFSQDASGVPESVRVSREEQLRGEFNKATAPFREQAYAAGRLIPILEGGGGGVNDLALIMQFMKILDPGSTVREGEITNVKETSGIPGQAANLFNVMLKGDALTPEQRDKLTRIIRGTYQSASELYQQQAKVYTGLAQRNLVAPENVVLNDLLYSPDQISAARETGRALDAPTGLEGMKPGETRTITVNGKIIKVTAN